ncbi:VOC family protein [Streptomyces lydicus]|uniref:VOC family protein n=1 Tax=Streptomyces lydicus TaxID=47763 RepID=UPI003713A21E
MIVVDDLDAVIAFFVELGMQLPGQAPLEARWAERVIGLDDVQQDIAMPRVPGGHGRIELAKFHRPKTLPAEPKDTPANTPGMRRVMCAVDDIDDVLTRLRRHGGRTRRRTGAVRGQLPALLPPRPRGPHRRTGRATRLRLPTNQGLAWPRGAGLTARGHAGARRGQRCRRPGVLCCSAGGRGAKR